MELVIVILVLFLCVILYAMKLHQESETLRNDLDTVTRELLELKEKHQRTLEEHKVQVAQLDRVTEFLRSKLEETQLKLPNEVAELTRKTRTSDSRSSACEKKAGAEKDNLTSISSYSLSSDEKKKVD